MRGPLFILVAAIAWGLEYPLMTSATRAVGMPVTGACLFVVSSLLLGASLLARHAYMGRTGKANPWPGWSALSPTLLVGAFGITANLTGLQGASLTTPVNMAALARSDVLFSLLISVLVFRERIARQAYLFVPVMLLGACLLVGVFRGAMEAASIGDGLVLISAFFVAANAFAAQRALRRLNGLAVGFMNCTLNAVMFVVVVGCTDSLSAIPAALRGETGMALIGLGVLAYIFFACYNVGLRTCPAWEARLICLLAPVVAAVVSWGFQGKSPESGQIPGMLLILLGAAGIVWLRAGRATAVEAAPADSEMCAATEREST